MNDELQHIKVIIDESVKRILKENPDTVHYIHPKKGFEDTLRWDDENAAAFIVDFNKNELFIGEPEVMHSDLISQIIFNKQEQGEINVSTASEYNNLLNYYENETIHGRLWFRPYVISFYKVPAPDILNKILSMLNTKIKEEYNFNLPINDLCLDTGVRTADGIDKVIPVEEYLSGNNTETRNSDKVPHFMSAEEKRNDKEMGQYLKDKVKNQSEYLTNDKGKEMSRAEYNTLRRPYSESTLKENNIDDIFRKRFEEYFNSNAFKKSVRAHLLEPDENYIKNRSNNLGNKLWMDSYNEEMPEAEWRALHNTSENFNK